MRTFLTFVGTLVALIIAFLIYIYSGLYDISATVPHNAITKWIINKTVDNSIKYHAELIEALDMNDTSLINLGYNEYTHSCIGCHGGPGITKPPNAPSMYPHPPALEHAATEWKPAELYWIIKNGIKMTGMPEFGSAKSNNQLWSLVAFVKKMTKMTPEQFKALRNSEKKDLLRYQQKGR